MNTTTGFPIAIYIREDGDVWIPWFEESARLTVAVRLAEKRHDIDIDVEQLHRERDGQRIHIATRLIRKRHIDGESFRRREKVSLTTAEVLQAAACDLLLELALIQPRKTFDSTQI